MLTNTNRLIAVDVDGTLLIDGVVNRALVDWCRSMHADGWSLLVWSARGGDYARQAVDLCGLSGVVIHAISKPQAIVDDNLWLWTRDTLAMRPTALARS